MSNATPHERPLQHPEFETDCTGVLLVNSGTPESLSIDDMRRFLGRLLGDPRVVQAPRWLWLPILHGIILRTRPRRSARKYQKIWTEEGSPLACFSTRLASQLEVALREQRTSRIKVAAAMLYSKPYVKDAIQDLMAAGARKLLIMPLFPQASGVSTGAVFDQLTDALRKQRWLPSFQFLGGYHDHPAYLEALRQTVLAQWAKDGRTNHVVFAFHGIPQKYFEQGDPYYCFCHKTSRLLADALDLKSDNWTLTFQSRFGPGRWLKPYTNHVLQSLPARHIDEVTVISPGFAVDCLETLEELAIDGRQTFLNAGGRRYEYVPALNASETHTRMLIDILKTGLAS